MKIHVCKCAQCVAVKNKRKNRKNRKRIKRMLNKKRRNGAEKHYTHCWA